MKKDIIGYILIFVGFGLFIRTLLINLNFSLQTDLLICGGLGLLVYGILILIELNQNKNDSKTDEKVM
jgi:FtsH-binding integral membrane protein|tara:strand:+ start:32 stop:235 length:204 start_codon:yes stop_codon:yes gene_type:complete